MTSHKDTLVSEEIRQDCEAYRGRHRRVVHDTMAPEAAEKLAVLLNRKPPGERLPPTWHWAYFNLAVAEEAQGYDLHEETGRFLPPAPFQRRMWASSDLTLTKPLRLGTPATKTSVVADVTFKKGKQGGLCFVTVRHEIAQDGALCLTEDQVIVYRDRGAPEQPLRQPSDPVPAGYDVHSDGQLFFYSCLTHNGHRIHWDRQHCREVEGYPDLVVHGPLMATMLCGALTDTLGPLRFTFRALAPVFATTPVRMRLGAPGTKRDGWIERSDGVTSMSATLATL